MQIRGEITLLYKYHHISRNIYYFDCYSVLLVDYLDCATPIPIMCNTAKIMQLGLTSAFGNILWITTNYFLEKHLESSLLFFVSKLKNNYQTWNSFNYTLSFLT